MNLSIIVPVYKVQQYIERCARSLFMQTLVEDIEYLFIDDCSPDDSILVLEKVIGEFPERQSQIRIIRNEFNMGVSETRKKGVSLAQGKYIGWCDSDDWVEPDMFEKMLLVAQEDDLDIVSCSYVEEKGVKDSKAHELIKCKTPDECITNVYKGYYLPGSLWQNIYRKEIIQYAMNRVKRTSYGEDMYANFIAFAKAKTNGYTSGLLYHYNSLNEGSLLHNIDVSKRGWISQKENLIVLAQELYAIGGYKKYHIAVNAYTYHIKQMYRASFCSIKEYYYEFSECYKDVNAYLFTPDKAKLKTWLVFNIYLLFRVFDRAK